VSRSIQRFEEAARAAGLPVEVVRFPEGTRTAADAARAIGCEVGQIVKSLVFVVPGGGRAVLALTSGSNRADPRRLAEVLGVPEVRRANADEAREATGYAIGGTPPMGHPAPLETVIDEDLLAYEEVWAAAGTPDAVFRTTPTDLVRAAGARPAAFAES
jgi:prolyl-tRNA editing enzyme YbaK/EbsC (Cys-tRNA(Pro) deacylase)